MSKFNEKALEKALNAIFDGPEKKKVKIKKHEFNFKPIEIRRENESIFVNGNNGHHISHHLRFRPDDQIFYEFEITADGTVEDLEVKISKGSDKLIQWAKTTAEVIALIKVIVSSSGAKSDLADDLISEVVTGKAEGLLDGGWRGEAMFVIGSVMLTLIAEQVKKVNRQNPPTRRQRRPFLATRLAIASK